MLGIREPDIYGKDTYCRLKKMIKTHCRERKIGVTLFQSNHEGKIVDKIQKALGKYDGIVINPAAYTHTSVAILDALKAVNIPAVEVHISDLSKRDDFRQISFVRQFCEESFVGFGFDGYIKAISYLEKKLS